MAGSHFLFAGTNLGKELLTWNRITQSSPSLNFRRLMWPVLSHGMPTECSKYISNHCLRKICDFLTFSVFISFLLAETQGNFGSYFSRRHNFYSWSPRVCVEQNMAHLILKWHLPLEFFVYYYIRHWFYHIQYTTYCYHNEYNNLSFFPTRSGGTEKRTTDRCRKWQAIYKSKIKLPQ